MTIASRCGIMPHTGLLDRRVRKTRSDVCFGNQKFVRMKLSSDKEIESSRFVIRPNCSISWRDTKIFVISLAILSIGIAIVFAIQGLWVILPFAGAEVLSLAGVLYWISIKTRECEVISIDHECVRIESGRDHATQLHELQTAWTSVQLYPPAPPTQHGRLVMKSKGKEYEVGAFLNEDERKSLATSINNALAEKLIYRN